MVVGSAGAAGAAGFLCRPLMNLITTNSTKATMRKLMTELTNSPILMLEPPRLITTSEKSALKNRPISGLMTSSTRAVTMAVNAPPMTTPTAISSTLPRMAKALNSSKNFLIPLISFSGIRTIAPFQILPVCAGNFLCLYHTGFAGILQGLRGRFGRVQKSGACQRRPRLMHEGKIRT